MDIMISVIVPVYDSEDFLHVCLNSVLKQTYQDFEIICIDDNSTDSSLEILEFFSKKDSRIKIIKNNYHKGLSHCLNKGLEVAEGKYISFLDSKDWLSFNYLESLKQNIEDNLSEIVVFKNIIYDNDNQMFLTENINLKGLISNFKDKTFNYHDLDQKAFFETSLNITNCFYLKSFLNKNNLKFPYKNNSAYDVFFYNSIISANTVSLIDESLYNHRKTPNLKKDNEILDKFDIFKVFLENKEIYGYFKKELFNFIINSIFSNKSTNKDKYESWYDLRIIFQELILKYGLYEDIKENVDLKILEEFKFEELASDLKKTYPKVSIIVPVFNVEKYLSECLNSICNQSFKNLEIICVNDGSTDQSSEILENFVKNDLRITIINQENHGLGHARNIGLKNSKGNCVLFVDSDDYLELDAIEYAYNNLISNDSDLAIFKFSRFNEENINYSQTGFPLEDLFGDINYSRFTFTYRDIKHYVLNSSFSAWSKIYNKEFLDKYDFSFPVGIAYEDVLFHVEALLKASSISFVPKFLYNYRLSNSTSIMSDNSNVWDIFEVSNYVEEYLKTSDYFKEFKLEFLMFKITQLSQYLKNSNSEKYFLAVKSEFEHLIEKGEIDKDYFMNLTFRNKDIFYTLLNSRTYDEFLENLDKKY